MSTVRIGLVGAQFGLLLALVASGPAHATPDAFALGLSSSGEECDAQASDHDPLAQIKGARAWAVQCKAWPRPLGHLYTFTGTQAPTAWPAKWVSCSAADPLAISGFSKVTKSVCKDSDGGEHVVLEGVTGSALARTTVLVEGQTNIPDLLEKGLKTVAGLSPAEVEGTRITTSVAENDNGEARRRTAYVLNQQWQFIDAETQFARLAQDERQPPVSRAEAYLNWALNASNAGRLKDAGDHFSKADALVAKLDDPLLILRQQVYKAIDALNRREFSAAIALAADARTYARTALEETVRPATTDIDAATALALNSNGAFNGLSGLEPRQRAAVLEAQADYTEASADWDLGNYPAAAKALDKVDDVFLGVVQEQRGQALLRSAAWLRADGADLRARLAIAGHNNAEALRQAKLALDILRERPDLTGSPAAGGFFLQIAEMEREAGALDASLADYRTGFQIFAEARRSLGDSSDEAALYLDTLIEKSKGDPTHADSLKESYFLAMQSVVDETVAAVAKRLYASLSVGNEEASHLARLYEDAALNVERDHAELQRLQDAEGGSAEIATVSIRIKAEESRAEALQQKLIQVAPGYGGMVESHATIKQIQDALQPGEVYVKALLLESKGFGIAITKADGAVIYPIERNRDLIQEDVYRLRRPFDKSHFGPFDVDRSHTLFKVVFGPAAPKVASATHLIYEPEGALASLPAEVFAIDDASVETYKARRTAAQALNYGEVDFSDTAWLGRKTNISLVTSASAFIAARRAPASARPRPFLGFGGPHTEGVTDPRLFSIVTGSQECQDIRQQMLVDLHALPKTEEQVKEIGKRMGADTSADSQDIVVGDAFSDTAVKQRTDLQQYRVVYFGTHGLLGLGDCQPEPALVTSLGGGQSDGLLLMSDIVHLKLDADLVVLSACDTGGGASGVTNRTGLKSSGAALDGLVEAFTEAGARNLIVSHWKVDENSTNSVMLDLFKAPPHTTQAEALRQAQLKLMDKKETAHPYYWAAFSVVGDGNHLLPGRQ